MDVPGGSRPSADPRPGRAGAAVSPRGSARRGCRDRAAASPISARRSSSIPWVTNCSSSVAARVDHAERRVARARQLGRRLDEPVQQCVERQLGADGEARFEQCAQPSFADGQRVHGASLRRRRDTGKPQPSSAPPPMPPGASPDETRGERRRKMKALVYHGPGQRTWEDVPDPTIQAPTDAIVKIDSSTICGTDLHILKGDVPEVQPGTILGHEAVGHRGRDRKRRHHARARRPRARLLHHLVRSLPVLQGRPLRALHRRRRLDLRPPDRRAAGRATPASRSPTRRSTRCRTGSRTSRCSSSPTSSRPRTRSASSTGASSRATPSRSSAPARSGSPTIMTAQLHSPGRIVAIDLDASRLEKALEFGADVTIDNSKRGRRREGDGADRTASAPTSRSRRSACRRRSSSAPT